MIWFLQNSCDSIIPHTISGDCLLDQHDFDLADAADPNLNSYLNQNNSK